jgi:hypothetical protein
MGAVGSKKVFKNKGLGAFLAVTLVFGLMLPGGDKWAVLSGLGRFCRGWMGFGV